jgi:hypothetical protein
MPSYSTTHSVVLDPLPGTEHSPGHAVRPGGTITAMRRAEANTAIRDNI